VNRWNAYVTERLDALERGDGDYTGLQRPSAATVTRARLVAAETFRDTTPTPSVVPDEDGAVCFVWHKNGQDVEITVTEDGAGIWAHGRETGQMWSSPLGVHAGCCEPRVLDMLEASAVIPASAGGPGRRGALIRG
jgi:hypothetical protein